jgi:hypothetical protein
VWRLPSYHACDPGVANSAGMQVNGEDPPRPLPIPRPDEPPDVIDDPPPKPNADEFTGAEGPAHHPLDLPAAAAGIDEPFAPIEIGVPAPYPRRELGRSSSLMANRVGRFRTWAGQYSWGLTGLAIYRRLFGSISKL